MERSETHRIGLLFTDHIEPSRAAFRQSGTAARSARGDRPYSSFRRWVRLGIYPENWADDPGPLTGDVIRAGSFASVNELVRDINAYLVRRNADPKPYVWRAQGADILAKINRARAALDNAPAA